MKLYIKDFFITDEDIKVEIRELNGVKDNILSLSLIDLKLKYPTQEEMFKDEECRRTALKACEVLERMLKTKIYQKII